MTVPPNKSPRNKTPFVSNYDPSVFYTPAFPSLDTPTRPVRQKVTNPIKLTVTLSDIGLEGLDSSTPDKAYNIRKRLRQQKEEKLQKSLKKESIHHKTLDPSQSPVQPPPPSPRIKRIFGQSTKIEPIYEGTFYKNQTNDPNTNSSVNNPKPIGLLSASHRSPRPQSIIPKTSPRGIPKLHTSPDGSGIFVIEENVPRSPRKISSITERSNAGQANETLMQKDEKMDNLDHKEISESNSQSIHIKEPPLNSSKSAPKSNVNQTNEESIPKEKTTKDINEESIPKEKTTKDINEESIPKEKTTEHINKESIQKEKTIKHEEEKVMPKESPTKPARKRSARKYKGRSESAKNDAHSESKEPEKAIKSSDTKKKDIFKDTDSQIDLSSYIKQNCIGSGSFGKVYKVKDKRTGRIYAAKISKKEINDDSSDLKTNISREVNIMSKIDHPSILKFIGYSPVNFKRQPKPVIVTEYSPNGTLKDLINSSRDSDDLNYFNPTYKIIMIYGIASALSYLHSHNIIHRDLKPDNILIDENNLPKIADFGLSKVNHSKLSMTNNSNLGLKGTPLYLSPEIWRSCEYNKPCDVYAFAFIVYEIITNERPFKDFNYLELASHVLRGGRPAFVKPIPKSYQDLIERCWSQNPRDRPTFDQIVNELKTNHEFITDLVDEKEYFNYIKYIDECKTTFNPFKIVIKNKQYASPKLNQIFNRAISICPYKILIQLSEECQSFLEAAEYDLDKQFEAAKGFIKEKGFFPRNNQLGIKYLKHSLKNGCLKSLIYYCKMLIKGKHIPKNSIKAKKLIDSLPSDQESTKLYLYGLLYYDEKQYNEAFKSFEDSINLGNIDAMLEYGLKLHKGDGITTPIEDEEIFKYYLMAIDNGSFKAMYKLGKILLTSKKNIKDGVEYIKNAANNNYPKALYYYSLMLENGNEVTPDIEQSKKYLAKAAELDNIKAMNKYGLQIHSLTYLRKASNTGKISYIRDYGMELIKDEKHQREGANLIKIAANEGDPISMKVYGDLLFNGRGVDIDVDEAINYYKMAIDKNNIDAIHSYAEILQYGLRMEENPDEAMKIYRKGIDQGDTRSMFNLSMMLFQKGDTKEALNYMSKAYFQGDEYTQNLYKTIIHEFGDATVTAMDLAQIKLDMDNINDESSFNNICQTVMNIFLRSTQNEGKETETNSKEIVLLRANKILADSGIIKAMYNYAYMQKNGEGCPVNKKEAAKYFKMGADRGSPICMSSYAVMLFNGDGIDEDKEEAIKYLKLAADYGSPDSIYRYEKYLEKGIIDEEDDDAEQFSQYLKKSADKGNKISMRLYAAYLFGIENNSESFKYFKAASDLDDHPSMFYCGVFLEKGIGVPVDLAEANKYLKKAADSGYLDAILTYIVNLCNGNGIEANMKEAFKYAQIGADIGNMTCLFLCINYLRKMNNPDDKDLLVHYYKRGVERGDENSIIFLADMIISDGDKIKMDKEEANKYFKIAADIGFLPALKQYADNLYEGNGIEMNKEEAFKYYKLAANKGNSYSMDKCGLMLEKGEGVEINKKEAIKYYNKAAIDGENVHSLLKYGIYLEEGDIIEIDKEKANQHFKESADKGYLPAIEKYADNLYEGNGIEVNKEEAFKYYKFAADKGNPHSMFRCGLMLDKGDGVEMNKIESINYYKQAIEKRNVDAMYHYGLMLEEGNGVEKDIKEANKYFKMASDLGHTEAFKKFAKNMYERRGFSTPRNEAYKYNEQLFKYIEQLQNQGDLYSKQFQNVLSSVKFEYELDILKRKSSKVPTLGNLHILEIDPTKMYKIEGKTFNKAEAFKYYKSQAEKGDVNAMKACGYMLYNGDGIAKNKSEAIQYFKMAIDKWDSEAMFIYGYLLKNGDGVEKDEEEAIKNYQTSADLGYLPAIKLYGLELASENGPHTNKEEGFRFFKVGSEMGDLYCSCYCGYMLDEGDGIPINKAEAIEYYKIGVNKGDKDSLRNYSYLLENGDGIKMNKEEANKYLKKAVDLGDPRSIEHYANKLNDGDGIPINKKEAFKYFKILADDGNSSAMFICGEKLEKGEGVEMNKEKANKYYKKSADSKYLPAMKKYADNLFKGNGIEMNKEEAFKYYKLAAEEKDSSSMFKCGVMLDKGDGIESNKEESIIYYKQVIDQGNREAMFNYGLIKEEEDVSEANQYFKMSADLGYLPAMIKIAENSCEGNGIEAFKYFYLASKQGDVESMFKCGEMLYKGDVITRNRERANKFYKKSADLGYLPAIKIYAYNLYYGRGIDMDKDESISYYKLAAEKGDEESKTLIVYLPTRAQAEKFYKGIGTEENKEEAFKYYKLAAEKGDAYSMNFCGVMLRNGDGIPSDIEEAIKYFKMGVDNDFDTSMYNLGNLYCKGEKVEKNLEEANKYYKMAADKGNVFSMKIYADHLFEGYGIEANKEEAEKYYRMAAEEGDIEAQRILDRHFKDNGDEEEDGPRPDIFEVLMGLAIKSYSYTANSVSFLKRKADRLMQEEKKFEALDYYRKAAEKGDAESMCKCGLMLLDGDGIPVNNEEGFKYIKMAVKEQYPQALFIYAKIYEKGELVEKDMDVTLKYLKMAADLGYPAAARDYATKLARGNGIDADLDESIRYFKLAAQNGDTFSMAMCGFILWKDKGAPEDLVEAAKYFKMAVDNGDGSFMPYYLVLQAIIHGEEEEEEEAK
ncbi:hypothetical protein M9Y10_006742 [Tritrichomonas musculus]|uniref:Protein kinase domain-containing protein n=1 Tax=Tritrichomonas musculus TaxID=1915356 RepID=A0ABR2JEZ5_9EUKA